MAMAGEQGRGQASAAGPGEVAAGRQDLGLLAAPLGSGGSRSATTVLVAFAANLLVAVAKSVAAVLTGSASLLAETAHSWADTGNEVFLVIAQRRARRPPDDAHPLVRLDRQIDMFEQERAADAEVDALQLDKGHPPIVAGAAGIAASGVRFARRVKNKTGRTRRPVSLAAS